MGRLSGGGSAGSNPAGGASLWLAFDGQRQRAVAGAWHGSGGLDLSGGLGHVGFWFGFVAGLVADYRAPGRVQVPSPLGSASTVIWCSAVGCGGHGLLWLRCAGAAMVVG